MLIDLKLLYIHSCWTKANLLLKNKAVFLFSPLPIDLQICKEQVRKRRRMKDGGDFFMSEGTRH